MKELAPKYKVDYNTLAKIRRHEIRNPGSSK